MCPSVCNSLELDLVGTSQHHLRFDERIKSLLPLLAQLDGLSGGDRTLILIKSLGRGERERHIDLIETQSLGEVFGVEAGGAAASASEDGVDPLPLVPHDVVQVVRRATEARVLDAGVGPEEEDAFLACLLCIRRVSAAWAVETARRFRRRRLVRQKPEVLLVRAAEVRVHGAADGLGDLGRPVREQRLACLVVKWLLGADLGVE